MSLYCPKCQRYSNKQKQRSTVKGFTFYREDGRGIGWGDHFLPYKFMERTFERWANSTKQLLITSRGHQVPRKSAHCLQKEVGQNIKHKKWNKRARDGDPSQERNRNRGSFQTPGNPLTGGSEGSFGISEGNLTGRKNKWNPQITCLKATPSRKVPQTLASATSEWGRNGEERAHCLGWGPSLNALRAIGGSKREIHSIRKKLKTVKNTNAVFYTSESTRLFKFINECQKTQRSRILASLKSEVRQPQKSKAFLWPILSYCSAHGSPLPKLPHGPRWLLHL